MKQLDYIQSSWLYEAAYDDKSGVVYYDTGKAKYLSSSVSDQAWQFVKDVNGFAISMEQLKGDLSKEAFSSLKSAMGKFLYHNDDIGSLESAIDEVIETISDEEKRSKVKTELDTLKGVIVEDLATKVESVKVKRVIEGKGLVGTAFWIVGILKDDPIKNDFDKYDEFKDILQKHEKYKNLNISDYQVSQINGGYWSIDSLPLDRALSLYLEIRALLADMKNQ